MKNITDLAKQFEASAQKQNEEIEKSVRIEFAKLSNAIESQVKCAQSTYEDAIRGMAQKHWMQSTFNALPLALLITFSCTLTSLLWYLLLPPQHQHQCQREEE